jgi:ammonium transporter Rh
MSAAEAEKPLVAAEQNAAPAAAPAIKPSAFAMTAMGLQGIMTCVFYFAKLDLTKAAQTDMSSIYNYYVGVALMMFVGFGYLMSFLKAYGLGAVGLTMYTTCLGVEFAIIVESFMGKGNLTIDFLSVLNGNFAIAAVLISFGGLIGKISPLQITVFTCVELVCYCANKVFVLGQYSTDPLIADCGGTIIIHVFGAYFGLCACKVLGPPSNDKLNASSYTSDLFSLIGTVFLWLFWPSFVAGALDDPQEQTQALINTVLALLASTMTSFALTPMLMNGLIGTVPIQNATLAGGVSIGATANLVGPFGAVVVGGLAGLLSTWGFVKAPFLSDVDTCGIHNLHGMPGVFGGLVSIAVPIFYTGTGVSMLNQAIGLFATLAIACATGAGTGFILKKMDTPADPFTDTSFWECAEDIAKAA